MDLAKNVEKFVSLGGDDDRLLTLSAKQDFFWQLNKFRIVITAKRFFELDRPFLASVRITCRWRFLSNAKTLRTVKKQKKRRKNISDEEQRKNWETGDFFWKKGRARDNFLDILLFSIYLLFRTPHSSAGKY